MKIFKIFLAVYLSCVLFFFSAANAQAQPDWGTVDPGKAKEEYAKLQDGFKAKQFDELTIQAADWLLTNAPNHSEGLYKMAIECYQTLEKNEKDPAKKSTLRDKVMQLYDTRIEKKFYKDEADILMRKGYLAYFYWADRPEKVDVLYDLYKKIYELNKDNTPYSQLTYLMDLSCSKKNKGLLKEDEVLDCFDKLNATADNNIAAGKEAANWTSTKENIGKILLSCVKIDCDFITKNYIPKVDANPKDEAFIKKTMGYLISAKCYDNPAFLSVAEKLYEINKDPQLGSTIAKLYSRDKKLDKVQEWYLKIVEQITDAKEKSDIYLTLAKIYQSNNNKSEARKYALKSAEAEKSNVGEAYELIGDLYMSSYEICKGGNAVESRAVFLIAYDMYAKAGAGGKMSSAKAQFPSKEDIFTLNMVEGSPIAIGCWIGGSSTLRGR
jgi:tetratricopeptide (TPR) repeat protein